MPVSVVVGGQFGGEGKGKVAHFLAKEMKAKIAVRVGGTNSGHTVIDSSGTPIIFRQLPTAAILPEVICVIGAGSYVSPDILLEEVSRINLSKERLFIDPNATIITDDDKNKEEASFLKETIGSTQSGTGAALVKRISRITSDCLARNDDRLKAFIKPTAPFLRDHISKGTRIIIEGTQGFGLSLLHSDCYPYVTSRDTSAASFVSEAGLSPLDVDDVVLVLRAFPIRVAGNSGPLISEIDWDTVTNEGNYKTPIFELTSVTKTVRRVARFNPVIVRKSIMVNKPTRIVLNHLDYIDSKCLDLISMTDKAVTFINQVELLIRKKTDYLGFGPASMVQHKSSVSKGQENE